MTLSIITAFIGCWTPYFVVHLIHIWTEYQYSIADSVYAFAETLALFNSAINTILYGCFNVHLKRGLVEVCCPLRVRQQVSLYSFTVCSLCGSAVNNVRGCVVKLFCDLFFYFSASGC